MAEDNRNRWHRLPKVRFKVPKVRIKIPKVSFNSRIFVKRMRKVETATTRHANKFIIKRWSNIRDVQLHIIVWVIAMGLLIAATGLQLVWYQQGYRTMVPASGGTYAEAVLGPVETLNPIFAITSAEQSAGYLMFSSLLRYDRTGHLNYDLANGIKINDTNTIYTVSIRPDARWHDGTKLTVNDIAFTVGLLKNSDTRAAIDGWQDVTVKVIDDTTIEFSLQSTYAAFEHVLTFPILPEHILKGIPPASIRENNFSQNPVGSGPFKFNFIQSVSTNASRKVIHMVRNEDYYGGTAKLARFQLHIYDSVDAIINALSFNEVNAAADLSPTDTERIDTKRYVVSSKPIQSGVYAIINTKSELLADGLLRQALRLATDVGAIRDKLPSEAKELDSPFVSSQLTGELPKAPQYDQTAAKKMLDDNGWILNSQSIREKDAKQLKLSVITIKDSQLERVLEALVGQWRSIGIVIETKVVDSADIYQNIIQLRNFDVLLYQLNIGADPDVYAYWHSSQALAQGSNFSNYSNVISDDALLSARSRVETDLRNAKYITFAKQWLADVPAIGLYQSTAQYVRNNNVRSSSISTVLISPIDRYSDVLNWSAGTKSVYKTP